MKSAKTLQGGELAIVVEAGKVKVGGAREATTFKTNTTYMISGGRYTYEITRASASRA
jgi:hypothetical protein